MCYKWYKYSDTESFLDIVEYVEQVESRKC